MLNMRKILIVDDDPELRDAFTGMATKSLFVVKRALIHSPWLPEPRRVHRRPGSHRRQFRL
jgi:hypothetical protein